MTRCHLFVSALFILTLCLTQRLEAADPGVVIPLWQAGAPGFEDQKDEPELAKACQLTADSHCAGLARKPIKKS